MPNTRSAAKRMRSDSRRRLRNTAIQSELKTWARKLERWIHEQRLDEARVGFKRFTSRVDKAVKRGLLHRNTASRKKSRFARILLKPKTA